MLGQNTPATGLDTAAAPAPSPLSPLGPPPSTGVYSLGGILPVASPAQLLEEDKRKAEASVNRPVVQGLAAYVMECFSSADDDFRSNVRPILEKCMRQRRGEYEPEVLAEIKKMNGSEIYMMLSSNKCRAAASWIKDVVQSTRGERPYSVEPSAKPQVNPATSEIIAQKVAIDAFAQEQMAGGQPIFDNPAAMGQMMEKVGKEIEAAMMDIARTEAERLGDRFEDFLQEGGFYPSLTEFIDDLVTYPYAIMKGPVTRNRKTLTWTDQGEVSTKDELLPTWERVSPFNVRWARHAAKPDDGYLIEIHDLTRGSLREMIGVDGYDDAAIRAILDEHGEGGLTDWLTSHDTTEVEVVRERNSLVSDSPEATIKALQFWGSVMGKTLTEWGYEDELDPTMEYQCEVWMIGRWVFKAIVNPDPLLRKPYYKACYEEIPGQWEGHGVCDLVRDCQDQCNNAARALANNMGIASGPQAAINVDRLPAGEDITAMFPWKIWQTTSDPYGNTSAPIQFFQPGSNAAELLGVYEKFAVLADEYSGVPRYMTGDSPAGGAGRTASGMSMLMNNAGKSIKQVIGNIDRVMQAMLDRLHYHIRKYKLDPTLNGDIKIVARGVNSLVAKEQAQVRMNEIMNIVASNPMFVEIVGEEAIADLLREVTRPLNIDVVPPKEVIRARVLQKQMMQQMMMQQQMAMAGQPENTVEFDRDETGAVKGAKVMPGNRQRLQNNAPITDNFAPARK